MKHQALYSSIDENDRKKKLLSAAILLGSFRVKEVALERKIPTLKTNEYGTFSVESDN